MTGGLYHRLRDLVICRMKSKELNRLYSGHNLGT